MKRSTSNLTRCLALVMALVLLVSNVNLGVALQAFAVEDGKTTVNAGEIVAANYELTEAEENLLKSGFLKGEVTYDTFSGIGLVDVDTEQKTITAYEANGWVPTTASIVVGEETKETIVLSEGNTYTYDGNAFAVKVAYSLDMNVEQDALLKAAGTLKNALDTMKGAYTVGNTNLGTVVLAMPTLVDLIDGIAVPFMGREYLLDLEAPAAAAVAALNAQLGEGDDKLDLQDMNPVYNGAASKVQFLAESGAAYKAAIAAAYEALAVIAADPMMNNDMLDAYLQEDDTTYTRWITFKGIVGELVAGLKTAATTDWVDASAVKSDLTPEQFVALDALVNAVGTTTAVTAKNPLHIADGAAQANLSMFNVTVEVMLYTIADEVGTTKQVKHEHVEKLTLTLPKDTTGADINLAIMESGVMAAAEAAWGEAYVAGKYTAGGTSLPETLTEDVSFSIIYTPNPCTVTFGDGFVNEESKVRPYGYQLLLEKHPDAAQAYDYYVNGELMTQGSVVMITEDTTITRSAGKAYDTMTLYGVIADNYANPVLKAILNSGALNGNVSIALRKPDAADSESLVKLASDNLSVVAEYDADYMGLAWVPATYGENGTENSFGANVDVKWTPNTAKVQYKLTLTNFSEEQVAKILSDAAALQQSAADQLSVLDKLAGHLDTLETLNLTKLGALSGTIKYTELNSDPAKNAALKAEFTDILENGIIPNNVDANEYLKICNMIRAYLAEGTGGLGYYYRNSAAVINEISSLTGYLDGMTNDEEKMKALEILTDKAGFPEYVEKIKDMKEFMTEINEGLTAPSAMINLSSSNLYVLVEALEKEEAAASTGSGHPYLVSETLTAVDDSVAIVQVKVTAGGKTEAFTTGELVIGEAFAQAEYESLMVRIGAFVGENLENYSLYTAQGEDALKALVGEKLTQKATNVAIAYVPTEYEVVIENEDGDKIGSETVSVADRQITLPKHDQLGYLYEYTVFDQVITAAQDAEFDAMVTLTVEQIQKIADGENVIVRKEIHKAQEDLDQGVENATTLEWIEDENGNKTGLVASVDASKGSVMDFVNELIDLGYSYVEVSDEVVMQTITDTEVSLQGLLNAMLKDNTFGSHTLITLGQNGKGTVFTGTISLGKGAEQMFFEDLKFEFYLKSVPSQMDTVAKGLNAVKNYMSFRSDNGILNVKLNLPEKVYEVYLTALLASGELEKTNANAINNEIAFMFLGDYIETVINSDADTQTFQNTLDMLLNAANNAVDAADKVIDKVDDATDKGQGYIDKADSAVDKADEILNSDKVQNIDLTAYEKYYQMIKEAILGEGFDYEFAKANEAGKDIVEMSFTATGKTNINRLMSLLGIDPANFEVELAMIKEYKDGEKVSMNAVTSLDNTYVNYEAALLDVKQFDMDNKVTAAKVFDFTTDLPARTKTLAGPAVIMLLDDVDGDLNFTSATILDLNGKTVNGSISAKGKLIVIDSSLDTYGAGFVTGSVSGNVNILAGNYDADVSAFLLDGYEQDGTAVRNALYTFSKTGAYSLRAAGDNVSINIDTDFINEDVGSYREFAVALAAEIVVDLVANYYTAAALELDSNLIYDFEFHDLLGFINSGSNMPSELMDKVLDCIHLPEAADFINAVVEDLLDFAAIEAALNAEEAVATYTASIRPWEVEVEHITDGDYLTICLDTSDENASTITLSLAFTGDCADEMAAFAGIIDDIVEDDTYMKLVNVKDLDFVNKHFVLAGGAEAYINLDLSDYTTYMAIVLAYCTEDADRAAAIRDAVNADDEEALKAAIDATTVKEVFNALKVLNRTNNFADMAADAGITVTVEPNAKLEKVLIYSLAAAGKALEKLELTGTEGKLGSLETEYGVYQYANVGNSKSADITKRGYGVKFDLTDADLTIKVKLFEEEDCLWGDANHDGLVNGDDATLILQYELGIAPELFCTKRTDVNGNGTIDGDDATLVLQYELGIISKFPAEN